MTHQFTIDSLVECCKTYEKVSDAQQEIMKNKDKEIRRQSLRIAKLETIIINNVKNGKSFIL